MEFGDPCRLLEEGTGIIIPGQKIVDYSSSGYRTVLK